MHITKSLSKKETYLFGKIIKLIKGVEGMVTLLKQNSGTFLDPDDSKVV